MKIVKAKYELGIKAKDEITGFMGTLTGFSQFLGGYKQYEISARANPETSEPVTEWFPESRIQPIRL